MRVHELEPVYDVRVENFKPSNLHTQPGPMARLAIHGFGVEMDRHGQILLVLDKLFAEYENLQISRMPSLAVKHLPPFYRMGAGEGIPKDATICHRDIEEIYLKSSSLLYPVEKLGVFFLQTQIPGEKRPIWNDQRFSRVDKVYRRRNIISTLDS